MPKRKKPVTKQETPADRTGAPVSQVTDDPPSREAEPERKEPVTDQGTPADVPDGPVSPVPVTEGSSSENIESRGEGDQPSLLPESASPNRKDPEDPEDPTLPNLDDEIGELLATNPESSALDRDGWDTIVPSQRVEGVPQSREAADITDREAPLQAPARQVGDDDWELAWPDKPAHPRPVPAPHLRVPPAPAGERVPSPGDLLVMLGRNLPWIIALALILGAVAFLLSREQIPQFSSEASVLVQTEIVQGDRTIRLSLPTEEELVGSLQVAEKVVEDLRLRESPRSILNGLEVDTVSDTDVLVISYTHEIPLEARQRAQAFADAYLEFRGAFLREEQSRSQSQLEKEIALLTERLDVINAEIAAAGGSSSSLQTEANLLLGLIIDRQVSQLSLEETPNMGNVIQPASQPDSPISPNHLLNTMFGVVVGMALGATIPLLRDRLTGRLRKVGEIEAELEAPVLAVVPRLRSSKWRRGGYLLTERDWRSSAAEPYKVLRANFGRMVGDTPAAILVTSSHAGEGKTATVANLGVVLARAGRRVIVMSADLRRPRLHRFFRVQTGVGLLEALKGEVDPQQALTATGISKLRMLRSTPIHDDPAELLGSEEIRKLITGFKESADYVLIDGPPILPVADTVSLSHLTDGILLVVSPRSSTTSTLSLARENLEKAGGVILGAVLNNFGGRSITTDLYG